MRVEGAEAGLVGRGGAEADVAVRADQEGHRILARGLADIHEVMPPAAQAGELLVVGAAGDDQVMPRPRQGQAVGIAVARGGACGGRPGARYSPTSGVPA